eukprot:Skav230940  [mRNA]  locus=scaffold2774:176157:180532:- [translate_table: standard]
MGMTSSSLSQAPKDEAAQLILEVSYGSRATNYTFPDPASLAPAAATLTGLAVLDGSGQLPMRPYATHVFRSWAKSPQCMEETMDNHGKGRSRTVRVVASKNDPNATLQLRVDGTEYIEVLSHAWLQVEIRVTASSFDAESLAWDPG